MCVCLSIHFEIEKKVKKTYILLDKETYFLGTKSVHGGFSLPLQ